MWRLNGCALLTFIGAHRRQGTEEFAKVGGGGIKIVN